MKNKTGFQLVELTVAMFISTFAVVGGCYIMAEGIKKKVQAETISKSYAFSREVFDKIISPQRDFDCMDNVGGRVVLPGTVNFADLSAPRGVPVRLENVKVTPDVDVLESGTSLKLPGTNVMIERVAFSRGELIGYDSAAGVSVFSVELGITVREPGPGGVGYGKGRYLPVGQKTIMFKPNSAFSAGAFAGCVVSNPQADAESCSKMNMVATSSTSGICINPNGTLQNDPVDGCGVGRILMGVEPVEVSPGVIKNQKKCIVFDQVCGEGRYAMGFSSGGFVQCSEPIPAQQITYITELAPTPVATPVAVATPAGAPPPIVTPVAYIPAPEPSAAPAPPELVESYPACDPSYMDPCDYYGQDYAYMFQCAQMYQYCMTVGYLPAPTPAVPYVTPPPPVPTVALQPPNTSCSCGGNTIGNGSYCGTCTRTYRGRVWKQTQAIYRCMSGALIDYKAYATWPSSKACDSRYQTW